MQRALRAAWHNCRRMAQHVARTLLIAWITACTLLAVGSATARDIYVSNTAGDDSMDGSAPRLEGIPIGPVRTLAQALRLAVKGDRIILHSSGQPYHESISLSGVEHRGLHSAPLTIQGNGATLDGTAAVPPNVWEFFGGDIFRYRPPRLAHQQLMLGNRPARRRPVAVRRVLPDLASLEWTLMAGHIYFRVEPGKLPRDYDLKHSDLQTGITLYDVDHVRITDLTIRGFQLDGVNAHDGVRATVLEGLTCQANGRSGISVGGASRVIINRCRLLGNGEAEFRIEGHSNAWLNGSSVDTSTALAIQPAGGRLWIDGKPFGPNPPSSSR